MSLTQLNMHILDLQDVFETMCNLPAHQAKLQNLTSFDWRVLKSMRDFLQPAYALTTAASGQRYTTLSMQPLIYESLTKHILATINGTLSTGDNMDC